MLPEVRWRPEADIAYREICQRHARAATAIQGALQGIMYAGETLHLVPGTGNLRFVETRRLGGLPRFALYYTRDADGVYWIEQLSEL